MGKVTLDAATRAKLGGLGEQLELYDEAGTLLGYYAPHAPVGPFTEAEVEEAFAQTGPGRPLANILAELRKR
jgi:hypothetical protein